MAAPAKTSTSKLKKADRKYKGLGLGLEIWLIIFAVIASIPLVNMFALPATLMILSAALALYLLWRIKE